ncbi:histidine phosphatase family protein [Candidatus Kirkpatrickella diaphorinae]|uniref:Histidine phosphatase family protein n=1 Tax=Candidatus Kirkpatrickella diaphorinae TaxID=2984322 RepID=A0ABY6GIL4_9PROT|nr:histidine phosphatase family protein [Candidatus Kirkpatrickella diaphorinae]UYH51349.1 histidine phosphatase family protein [Candidatus Kirkpatrickella diaphorinae]
MILPQPFWYLRHGQTDWNARNLSQGRSDIPLNAVGRQQAIAAGEELKKCWDRGAKPITHIVTSPLGRARETARAAQSALESVQGRAVPLSDDEGLLEVSFGEKEGHPMGDWYDPWIAGTYLPQGCEPFDDLKSRAVTAVNRALKQPHGGLPLIVAHGALFRAIRAAMNLPVNVRLPNATPIYCAFDEGAWSLTPYEIKG